jgi:hypothetical protein
MAVEQNKSWGSPIPSSTTVGELNERYGISFRVEYTHEYGRWANESVESLSVFVNGGSVEVARIPFKIERKYKDKEVSDG